MKVEIINKPMLCWDDDEADAREFHVLAKVTECDTVYPYKAICNEYAGQGEIVEGSFKNAKPLPETIELTVAEISKLLGKTVKIVK